MMSSGVEETVKSTKKKVTSKKSSSRKKSSELDKNGEPLNRKSVKDIVAERLIERIESEQILPWQRPYTRPCINWYTQREYNGVNRILLSGSEYITFNQLLEYNKANGTDFSVKGLKSEIVVFYKATKTKITDKQASDLINKGKAKLVLLTDKGWVKLSWTLRYYRVFDISLIPPDSNGNKLEPRIGNTIIETYTPAEDIISNYCSESGVKITKSFDNNAWYLESSDVVGTAPMNFYNSSESYYRTIFHELAHSTGIKSRLNRDCFYKYERSRDDRSREELVAEFCSLLLASEAGFREDTDLADNSLTYIHGWVSWMKNNKDELVIGISQAEKAKNYILNGGLSTNPQKEGNLEVEDDTDDSDIDLSVDSEESDDSSEK